MKKKFKGLSVGRAAKLLEGGKILFEGNFNERWQTLEDLLTLQQELLASLVRRLPTAKDKKTVLIAQAVSATRRRAPSLTPRN